MSEPLAAYFVLKAIGFTEGFFLLNLSSKGASLEDALPHRLAREVPEAMKPRRIEISYPHYPRADQRVRAPIPRVHFLRLDSKKLVKLSNYGFSDTEFGHPRRGLVTLHFTAQKSALGPI